MVSRLWRSSAAFVAYGRYTLKPRCPPSPRCYDLARSVRQPQNSAPAAISPEVLIRITTNVKSSTSGFGTRG